MHAPTAIANGLNRPKRSTQARSVNADVYQMIVAMVLLTTGGGTGPISIVLLHCSWLYPDPAAARQDWKKSFRTVHLASRSVGIPVPNASARPISPKANVITAATLLVYQDADFGVRLGWALAGVACGAVWFVCCEFDEYEVVTPEFALLVPDGGTWIGAKGMGAASSVVEELVIVVGGQEKIAMSYSAV